MFVRERSCTTDEEVHPMQMAVPTTSPLSGSFKVTLAMVSSVGPSDVLTEAIGRQARTFTSIRGASPSLPSRKPSLTSSSRSLAGT
jgi:hypothetical protein